MEIQGAAFLYALAAAAMAFIGFSAIVVIIRQTLGAGLSPFQLLLTQVLIEHGFVVFFFSLLPLLLALFGISHESVWRIPAALQPRSFPAGFYITTCVGIPPSDQNRIRCLPG
jgi:hypothetical protein